MLMENIDNRIEEIYVDFKKDKKDKTGWSFLRSLKKESDSHPFLFSFLVYRSFEIAYKKGEIINADKPLKKLLESPQIYKRNNILHIKEKGTATESEIEIFPGVILKKTFFFKLLESLGLEKTKKHLYYYFIIKEKEINEGIYLSDNQIKKFYSKSGEELISEIFWKEYKEKGLDKNPKIIDI